MVLAVGSLATHDLTTLFVWDRFARGLVGAIGAYVLLRQWAEHWSIRLLLPPLLVWSSFLLAVFHQTAIIDQFISAPWAAYFILRIAHRGDLRWRNWLGLALSAGTAWQSYYFAGLWILLLFLASGLLLFCRRNLKEIVMQAGVGRKAVVTGCLIAVMAFPNAVVLAKRADWVYPARMLDHSYVGQYPAGGPLQYEPPSSIPGSDSIFMGYGAVQYTGTFSSPWDFLQLLTPEGNPHARGENAPLRFGRPSEAFMYVGLLGYVVALWGLAAGEHPLKRVWLLTTLAFGFLMLGPAGGVQWLLRFFPPIMGVRHTHVFASFFVLGLLYFFVLGCNRLVRDAARLPTPPGRRWGLRRGLEVLACSIMLALAAACFLRVVSAPRRLPVVNWEVALAIGPLIVLGLIHRRLGAVGLFVAVLSAHLALILWHATTSGLIGHLVIFLALPALLLLATSMGRFTRHRRWALLVGAAMLLADLGLYVSRSSWLWHWDRPDQVMRISSFPRRPGPPAIREAVLSSEYLYAAFPQPIRYLSLLSRRPTAFSGLMYTPDEPEAFFRSTPVSLSAPAWSRGSERPAPSESIVTIPVPAALRHQRLWVRMWVKSSNSVRDAVQVEADFGTRRVVRSYGNSGGWEQLMIDGPGESGAVTVVARVRPAADAPASFERLTLRATPVEGALGDFDADLVRSARRWNTFIVPARYFELVHEDLPIDALAEMLALGAPAIQFRSSARVVPPRDLASELVRRGPTESKRILADTVLLETRPLDESPRAAQPIGGEPPHITIRSYDYNSLRLIVRTPAPGYVYVADGFDPGWRARVDGRASPVLRANRAFKAVRVEAGRHEVRLEYRPLGFQIALWSYFGAVAAVLAVVLVIALRQRD
ncbi:MAG TPA: YfhO family protein [Candidatus Deferrimicrobiaceae bacterium]|nr:YfhO family protein [Candidatus Deferrimicrobiaceae bacterium]